MAADFGHSEFNVEVDEQSADYAWAYAGNAVGLLGEGEASDRPTILSVGPGEGVQSGVLDSVLVTFSRDMDPGSVEQLLAYELYVDNEIRELKDASYVAGEEFQVILELAKPLHYPGGAIEVHANLSELRSREGIAIADESGELLVVTHSALSRVVVDEANAELELVSSRNNGDVPRDVAFMDISDDGLLDLITTDVQQARLSVFLQTTPGSFDNVPMHLELGERNYPWKIKKADWNQDGKLDLVVGASEDEGHINDQGYLVSPKFVVLLNDGEGKFSQAPETPILVENGSNVASFEVGDFWGDAQLDIAFPHETTEKPTVKIASKDPFLGYSVQKTMSADLNNQWSNQIHAADFNEDGRLDLVVNNTGYFALRPGANLFLSDGAGDFHAPTDVRLGVVGSTDLGGRGIPADINGDGHMDFVGIVDLYSNSAGVGIGASVQTLIGDGTGNFTNLLSHPLGPRGISLLAIEDITGDGNLDLVAASRPTFEQDGFGVWVIVGDGQGNFTPKTTVTLARADLNDLSIATLSDYDGDGRIDLALGAKAIGKVRLLKNDGDGNFREGLEFVTGEAHDYPSLNLDSQYVIADLNGDAQPDIVSSTAAPNGFQYNFSASLSDPSESFLKQSEVLDRNSATWIQYADLNNDSIQDVIAGDAEKIHVLLGDPDGNFSSHPSSPFVAPEVGQFDSLSRFEPPTILDVNSDGNLDLLLQVIAKNSWGVQRPQGQVVFFGDGTGALYFNLATFLPLPDSHYVYRNYVSLPTSVLDLTGDKIPDVLIGERRPEDTKPHLTVYAGRGNGQFEEASRHSIESDFTPITFEEIELNRDGMVHFVGTDGRKVGVYRQMPDGTFTETFAAANVSDFLRSKELTSWEAGDFNFDGFDDIAVSVYNVDSVDIFLNDQLGGFSNHVSVPTEERVQKLEYFTAQRKESIGKFEFSPHAPPLHNATNMFDVNGDGFVSPIDALLVINHLNGAADDPLNGPPYLDPSADQVVSPLDALMVINWLNSSGAGEGEEVEDDLDGLSGVGWPEDLNGRKRLWPAVQS